MLDNDNDNDLEEFIMFILKSILELANILVDTIDLLIYIFDFLIFDILWGFLEIISNDFLKIEQYYFYFPKYINKHFDYKTGEFKLSISKFLTVIIESDILKASNHIILFLGFILFFFYFFKIRNNINKHISSYLDYNPRFIGKLDFSQIITSDLYYNKPYLIQRWIIIFFILSIPTTFFSCLVHSLWYGFYSFYLVNIGKLITVSSLFYIFSFKLIICFIIFRDLTIIFYLKYKCPSDYNLNKRFSSYHILKDKNYFIKKHSSWRFFIKYNLLLFITFSVFILIPYILFKLTGSIPVYSSKTLIKDIIKQTNFFYSKTYLFTEPTRVMHNDFRLNKTTTILINTENFFIYIRHIYYSIIVALIVSSQILCTILASIYFLYTLFIYFLLIRKKNIEVIIVSYFLDHVDRDAY